MNSERSSSLSFNACGDLSLSLMEVFRNLCQTFPPIYLWREPRNRAKPLDDFFGLMDFSPAVGKDNVELTEARFFYESGCLHILEKCDTTLWSLWWDGTIPENLLVYFRKVLKTFEPKPLGNLQRSAQTVLIRPPPQQKRNEGEAVSRALDERGLGGAKLKGNDVSLAVMAYRYQGRIIWWRLGK